MTATSSQTFSQALPLPALATWLCFVFLHLPPAWAPTPHPAPPCPSPHRNRTGARAWAWFCSQKNLLLSSCATLISEWLWENYLLSEHLDISDLTPWNLFSCLPGDLLIIISLSPRIIYQKRVCWVRWWGYSTQYNRCSSLCKLIIWYSCLPKHKIK